MAIKVKKLTYTPANIYSMFATPILALPAPPSGSVNNVLAISHDMVFNSAAYTGASHIIYGFTLDSFFEVYFDGDLLAALTNGNIPLRKWFAQNTIFSTTKDLYVTTEATAATGDSNIDAYVVYEEIVLNP